jgi:hypothetical protein
MRIRAPTGTGNFRDRMDPATLMRDQPARLTRYTKDEERAMFCHVGSNVRFARKRTPLRDL